MFLIAEQEEDYEAGGFSPVLDTPFPLTRFPPLVLPVLAQYLCWDTVFSPWFGALPKEAIFTYTSLLISARYFQGTLFRARSGCWVTEQLPFFHFEGGNEQSDSPRLYFTPHASCCDHCLGALIGASLHQLQGGSSKYSGLKSQVGTSNLCFSYTELPFNCSSHCTGPNCNLWAKTKIWLACFSLEFSLNCILLCSKFPRFCFILMFYSTWIWGFGRLDDTSIGNYLQFYIKGLNHLCGIQIYRGVLCVKDLVDSCTRCDTWGRKMLVKYNCLPLWSIFACIQLSST